MPSTNTNFSHILERFAGLSAYILDTVVFHLHRVISFFQILGRNNKNKKISRPSRYKEEALNGLGGNLYWGSRYAGEDHICFAESRLIVKTTRKIWQIEFAKYQSGGFIYFNIS
uniref:Uncharacterized protein n=1 Tax=Glossina pallidipes TaxID=7398 RepID=A0A1A9Z842_GLOPL